MIVIYVFIFKLMKLVIHLSMYSMPSISCICVSVWFYLCTYPLARDSCIHWIMLMYVRISNPNKTKVHWQTLARLRTLWVVSATVWEEHGLLGCLSYTARCLFCDPKGMTGFEASNTSVPRRGHVMSHSNTLIFKILWVQDSRTAMTQSVDPVAINPKCRLRSILDWCKDASHHNKHTKMHGSRKVWNSWSCYATQSQLVGDLCQHAQQLKLKTYSSTACKPHRWCHPAKCMDSDMSNEEIF